MSTSSVPVTVSRVPPACGPNSGHTLLTVGPTAVPQHITYTHATVVAVMPPWKNACMISTQVCEMDKMDGGGLMEATLHRASGAELDN